MAHNLGNVVYTTTDGLTVEIIQNSRYFTYIIKDVLGNIFKAIAHPNILGVSWEYSSIKEDGFTPIDPNKIKTQHMGIERYRIPISSQEEAEDIILRSVRKVAAINPPEVTALYEIENCVNSIKYSKHSLQVLSYISTMQEYLNHLRDLWTIKAANELKQVEEAYKIIADQN